MVDFTIVISVVAVAVGALGALVGQLYSRTARLEREVRAARSYSRRLWSWARAHVDLYYRNRREGAPDPTPIPDEDDEEEKE